MHYSNLVIVPKTDDVEAAVKEAMGPHEDDGGFWDWYQIGGRFTGYLDGYDPERDSRNIVACEFCNGIGEVVVEVGVGDSPRKCRRCNGTGFETKWPTRWASHPGDVIPIEDLTDKGYLGFYRIVCPRGIFERERYVPWQEEGDKFVPLEMPPLEWLKQEFPDHLVVVVDNHD
jgi:hypothetical protein